jgi:hypothetical protein
LSWDVLLIPDTADLGNPPNWDILDDICMTISREDFIARICEILPDALVEDNGSISYESKEYSIEFNLEGVSKLRTQPCQLIRTNE